MALRPLFIFTFIFSNVTLSLAQERDHGYKYELKINIENDWFLFTDKYYTSGLELQLNKRLGEHSFINKIIPGQGHKTVGYLSYNAQIFTPSDVEELDFMLYDRPYAGYQRINFGFTSLSEKGLYRNFKLELGYVGPESGVGNFQEWWHRKINFNVPVGWRYQVDNQAVVNVALGIDKNLKFSQYFDLVVGGTLMAGIRQTGVYPRIMFRFGNLGDFSSSALFNSRTLAESTIKEDYFFYSIEPGFVFHNLLIEGELAQPGAMIFTTKNFLIFQRWGYVVAGKRTSLAIIVNGLTSEVEGGDAHFYAS